MGTEYDKFMLLGGKNLRNSCSENIDISTQQKQGSEYLVLPFD